MDHSKDSDCTLNPETNECVECGVLHGDPCLDCGGRGFHKDGCPEMDPEDGRVFACQTFERPRESKQITGGEYFRFLNPGVSDEYDHDVEEEME